MKRFSIICIIFAAVSLIVKAETLSLEDITRGVYSARTISGVRPMNDGVRYTQLSSDGRQITASSFQTGEQTDILFDVANTKGDVRLTSIDDYIFSPDEKTILVRTKTTPIYRHSFTAVYYIYNVRNRTLVPLSDGGPQEVPAFSKDGTMIAFVRDNNLFLVKLLYNNSESQVTTDGKFNSIINGKPDWVNEEEFSFSRAFDFNADNTMLAWIRYDETAVPQFSFPLYRGMFPSQDAYAAYPGAYTYKYPMAGEQNATVSVHTYDIKSHQTRRIQLPLDADGYVPRIRFTDDADKLLILTQNRHQDRLEVYVANPRSTECRLIVRDQVEPYITEEPYRNLQLTPGGFVLMSERSGFNHLYLYDLNGTLKRQLTKGDFVVSAFYGLDPQTGDCYYAANAEGAQYQAVYRADAKGRVEKLSQQQGNNRAVFSKNMRYYMNVYSNITTPPVTTLCDSRSGKTLKTLEDNAALNTKLASINRVKPEFFTFTTSEGVQLNGYMVKPSTLNPPLSTLNPPLDPSGRLILQEPSTLNSQKSPVIMFQYSGPGSQQVIDSWNAGGMGSGCIYEQYLAQQGFICVCVDGRGTGGRGAAFEKQTYQHLGQREARDQVETALWLARQSYVDAAHIGIWGWSYGGFCTLMSMTEGRPVFAAGVAVAPVTCYRFYDSVYTERFMRTPKENPSGYDDNPISRASQLNGALLLCHGLADDNVHFRNTAEFTEALVQAGKPFYELTYTNRNHSIFGYDEGRTRLHLLRSITNWFTQHLK